MCHRCKQHGVTRALEVFWTQYIVGGKPTEVFNNGGGSPRPVELQKGERPSVCFVTGGSLGNAVPFLAPSLILLQSPVGQID